MSCDPSARRRTIHLDGCGCLAILLGVAIVILAAGYVWSVIA